MTMATILRVSRNGTPVGRCWERCYDADSHQCHCVCKGANHGRGRAYALAGALEIAETWRALGCDVELNPEARQLSLW